VKLLVVFILLSFVAGPASAEVYRYTDNQGQLHFVDDIAKVPKKYRKQLVNQKPAAEISIMETPPALKGKSQESDSVQPQAKQAVSSGVEVFVTSSCGYCRKMLRFLNEKGIPYKVRDIEQDNEAARTFRQLGGRGVPVTRIGTRVINGYNPQAVMAAINGNP